MVHEDPTLGDFEKYYDPTWQAPDTSEFMRRERASLDLRLAQELLKRPRELTHDQWRQAYELIQGHNHDRLRETLKRSRSTAPVPDDDEADDFTADDRAAYMLETSSGPGIIRRR